jgi:hypothetical protein
MDNKDGRKCGEESGKSETKWSEKWSKDLAEGVRMDPKICKKNSKNDWMNENCDDRKIVE